MFPRLPNTKHFQMKMILLIEVSIGAVALFSTIECPSDIGQRILLPDTLSPLQKHSTPDFACSNILLNPGQLLYPHGEIYQEESFGFECDVNAIETLPANEAQVPCPVTPSPEGRVLLPHSGNCSLFYKCDWSTAVLFECPEELHFNADLQICDWPWQAGCDETWTRCPRPRPRCPQRHSRPLYLPHPYLCDQFYQCSWGKPYLQNCPTGLHFDPNLKVCDWPRKVKCHIC